MASAETPRPMTVQSQRWPVMWLVIALYMGRLPVGARPAPRPRAAGAADARADYARRADRKRVTIIPPPAFRRRRRSGCRGAEHQRPRHTPLRRFQEIRPAAMHR